MILIGISGKKKCGKSLFADHIKDLFPNRAHIVAFADPLKREVAEACDTSIEYIEKHKDDFRLILQGWGTNFRRRHHGADYWIKKYLSTCLSIATNYPNAIIITPDVRFANEAQAILNCNGVLLRIERTFCDVDDQHPSEVEMDRWLTFDAYISNNGTIEEFKQHINEIITKLKIK